MLLTEEEAKEKWCYRLFDAGSLKLESNRCIASECMAWRWNTEITDDNNEFSHGYCGLSGKPE